MSESQFPPSSPLLAAPEHNDPFASPLRNKNHTFQKSIVPDDSRGRDNYPTPNPSSTLGRSSSPQRHEDDLESNEAQVSVQASNQLSDQTPKSTHDNKANGVSINKDFNIINPHSSVLRVPLVKSPLTIGRSSRSCDIHLNRKGKVDKSVSRIHLKITHSPDSMALSCIGYNGFGIIIPRVCHVNKDPESSDSSPVYSLRETGKPLVANNVSKTIHLDYQHTEFYVSRGETVKMPRFPNVLVQVGSSVLLVNPDDCDEELTDDEYSNEKTSGVETKEKESEVENNASEVETRQTEVEKQKTEVETPLAMTSSTPKTPSKFRQSMETPSIFESTPSKGSRKPLGEKSLNLPEKQGKRKIQKERMEKEGSVEVQSAPSVIVERRARSEEPSLKKAKKEKAIHDANGKLIIDHDSIKGLHNRLEIENILINHLAFSRLSSTPASVLNTISAAVTEISLPQLRAILHNVPCIGVIYRSGKDAAGKPLEEEYYYMPEHDQDPERNQLVSSIKGHGGLRACRRTHKQYYWKKPAPIKK